MTSFEKNEHFYYDYFPFCSIQEKFLHWKRIENPFKFKLKLPVFRVVLKTPKTSLDKLTITAIKVQQRTIIEKTDAEVDISCLDWYYTTLEEWEKISRLIENSVTLWSSVTWTKCTLKVIESVSDCPNTRNSTQNGQYSWVKLSSFLSGELYWMKQLFILQTNFMKSGCSGTSDQFQIPLGIELVIWTQGHSGKTVSKIMLLLERKIFLTRHEAKTCVWGEILLRD